MSIRHNCEHGGCYIKTQTPDWGFLDNSFSGKISVSDYDGAVEVNGSLLILEWKRDGAIVPKGQSIMFEKVTKKSEITVFVIFGCPIENKSTHILIYSNGQITKDSECSNDYLKKLCSKWEVTMRAKN